MKVNYEFITWQTVVECLEEGWGGWVSGSGSRVQCFGTPARRRGQDESGQALPAARVTMSHCYTWDKEMI